MKKSMLLAGAAMLVTAATPALAQSTIAPGMTTEQVRDRFGAPATTRDQGDWSYWYYHNGCPVRCGSDDVVFFQNDRVVAAVLRTARRRFAGPAADDALGAAADASATDDAPGRATVGGVRVD
ncbi:outer membrane protein assembly factor BamE domain-containing protein, partial [Longimicrobium sp.]|uniref:outer membrane protein assembly factor BamE domain-containing protein n=1 Tax=Longimicrobium sp. TaxID=2029185 RepID=UPI003B3AEBD4